MFKKQNGLVRNQEDFEKVYITENKIVSSYPAERVMGKKGIKK
jgi:hypothetical protein